jgi:hypothetical protein
MSKNLDKFFWFANLKVVTFRGDRIDKKTGEIILRRS